MERFIYDESSSLWYELQGDYYLPCLTLPQQKPIGIWGQRHFECIKKNSKFFYDTLLMTDKLNDYLIDVNAQAEEMYQTLVEQMIKQEEITEKLKEDNQMEWVGRMNNIAERAREAVTEILTYRVY